MVAFQKIDDFSQKLLLDGSHDFDTHVYKLALTNTAPTVATDISWLPGTTAPAPAAVNGYTAGGEIITITVTEVGGVTTVGGDEIVFLAAGGDIGPFKYVLMYNDTAAAPDDLLVGYWIYPSNVTLADGETFTVTFNNDATNGAILTLT